MNKVELLGRLTDDVDLRYTATTNTPIATFNLAVSRKFAKKDDEIKTDFFRIRAWNKTAEFVSKYFRKGQSMALVGRLENGFYDDKDGKRVYYTDVIAEEIFFAGQLKNGSEANQDQIDNYMLEQSTITDDDLPF